MNVYYVKKTLVKSLIEKNNVYINNDSYLNLLRNID